MSKLKASEAPKQVKNKIKVEEMKLDELKNFLINTQQLANELEVEVKDGNVEEIEKAFKRKFALDHHPDKFTDEELKLKHQEFFKIVGHKKDQIIERIKNPSKKQSTNNLDMYKQFISLLKQVVNEEFEDLKKQASDENFCKLKAQKALSGLREKVRLISHMLPVIPLHNPDSQRAAYYNMFYYALGSQFGENSSLDYRSKHPLLALEKALNCIKQLEQVVGIQNDIVKFNYDGFAEVKIDDQQEQHDLVKLLKNKNLDVSIKSPNKIEENELLHLLKNVDLESLHKQLSQNNKIKKPKSISPQNLEKFFNELSVCQWNDDNKQDNINLIVSKIYDLTGWQKPSVLIGMNNEIIEDASHKNGKLIKDIVIKIAVKLHEKAQPNIKDNFWPICGTIALAVCGGLLLGIGGASLLSVGAAVIITNALTIASGGLIGAKSSMIIGGALCAIAANAYKKFAPQSQEFSYKLSNQEIHNEFKTYFQDQENANNSQESVGYLRKIFEQNIDFSPQKN